MGGSPASIATGIAKNSSGKHGLLGRLGKMPHLDAAACHTPGSTGGRKTVMAQNLPRKPTQGSRCAAKSGLCDLRRVAAASRYYARNPNQPESHRPLSLVGWLSATSIPSRAWVRG